MDLDELEQRFFVPVNAHPLKKVNDESFRDNLSSKDNNENLTISNSDYYKAWSSTQYKKFNNFYNDNASDICDRRESYKKHSSP